MSEKANGSKHHSGVAAAWAVLVGMGGTSVTYNVYHAVTHGQMDLALALLYGIAPVFAAACLSHIVAVYNGGWFMRAVAFAVMLGAMTLSIGATASVVAPTAGPLRWLFGGVLDAAALVALRVILDRRESDAAAGAELEDARCRIAESESAAAELRAELAGAAVALERAELRRAELEAELRAAAGRKPPRGSARKTARRPAAGSARKAPAGSAPETGDETDDLTTEMQALNIITAEPGINGSELGRRLGKTERYGRELLKRLAPVMSASDHPAESERAE